MVHASPRGLGQGPQGPSGVHPSVSGAAAQPLITGAETAFRSPGGPGCAST